MERIKFRKEWREAAKQNKISHRTMISCLGIEEKKFSNMFYGLVYIPDDLVDKVNEMVISLLKPDPSSTAVIKKAAKKKPDKKTKPHLPAVFGLVCGICNRGFEPWGADKDMGDQVAICPECYNMRQAIDMRKRKIFLLNEGPQ